MRYVHKVRTSPCNRLHWCNFETVLQVVAVPSYVYVPSVVTVRLDVGVS